MRKTTVKEVKKWFKTLEENRYKRTYGSDARRVSWMVNNNEKGFFAGILLICVISVSKIIASISLAPLSIASLIGIKQPKPPSPN